MWNFPKAKRKKWQICTAWKTSFHFISQIKYAFSHSILKLPGLFLLGIPNLKKKKKKSKLNIYTIHTDKSRSIYFIKNVKQKQFQAQAQTSVERIFQS